MVDSRDMCFIIVHNLVWSGNRDSFLRREKPMPLSIRTILSGRSDKASPISSSERCRSSFFTFHKPTERHARPAYSEYSIRISKSP